jgi:hypothetical protein
VVGGWVRQPTRRPYGEEHIFVFATSAQVHGLGSSPALGAEEFAAAAVRKARPLPAAA